MSAHAHPRVTPEQYLEIERAAEVKSEYYHGRMYAMWGASYRHVMITSNLSRTLGNALEGRACSVGTNDLRLRVSPGGLCTYPDLVVICGEPKFADDQKDTLLNPTVVVDVLSPSTEAYDRGFKSAQYRTVESLQEYAFVWQSEPRAEVYRRQADATWVLTESVGLEAACRFQSLDCAAALSRVYDKISFEGEQPILR